jgi:hypothetical protein
MRVTGHVLLGKIQVVFMMMDIDERQVTVVRQAGSKFTDAIERPGSIFVNSARTIVVSTSFRRFEAREVA